MNYVHDTVVYVHVVCVNLSVSCTGVCVRPFTPIDFIWQLKLLIILQIITYDIIKHTQTTLAFFYALDNWK